MYVQRFVADFPRTDRDFFSLCYKRDNGHRRYFVPGSTKNKTRIKLGDDTPAVVFRKEEDSVLPITLLLPSEDRCCKCM